MTKNPKIWKYVLDDENAPITQGFPEKGDIVIFPSVVKGYIMKTYEVLSDPVIDQQTYFTGRVVFYLKCRVKDIESGRERTLRWGRNHVIVPA